MWEELLLPRWWSSAQKPHCSWESPWRFWQRIRALVQAVREHTCNRQKMLREPQTGNVSRAGVSLHPRGAPCASLVLSSWGGALCPVIPGAARNSTLQAFFFFYSRRFMMEVGKECQSMFRAGKRSLHPRSLCYLAKWPCANTPTLHLHLPILPLH